MKRRFDEECSVIPMGGPLPVLGQPTVAYGAAAIMVPVPALPRAPLPCALRGRLGASGRIELIEVVS